MTTSNLTFAVAELRGWLARVWQRFGMFAVDAECLTDRLLEAEHRGRDGLAVAAELVSAFDLGDIDPRARLLTQLDLPAVTLLDGSTGVGQVGASRAMLAAIEKAHTAGIAVVSIRNSQPCGDVRTIAELASHAGCIGFITTNSGKAHWPATAEQPWLAAHPQAWSFPAGSGTAWTTTLELTAESPACDERWGVIALALTAGLHAARLPAAKKKASPYGSGAEHTCVAVSLTALVPQADGWSNWIDACRSQVATFEMVDLTGTGESLTLSESTLSALREAAAQSRIPLPESANENAE